MLKEIKGYAIRKQIGTGGFGEVYVAEHKTLNREVAFKVILPRYANQDDFIRRFQLEAKLVARLEHPHIVPLFDFWRDHTGAYLVMRYIKGGNLADHLLTHGRLSAPDASRLLEQIAGALHIAHRNEVVHQDIKPANILLDEDGNAYLTDFGIARDIRNNDNLAEDESNTVHGSPKYISPEILRRREVTHRSDIYSLGLVMYEVLTGSAAFDHEEMLKLLQMHIRNDLPLLQDNNPNLPDALNAPLQQATLKNPMSRYDNVLDFARDFQNIVADVTASQSGTIPYPLDYEVEITGDIYTENPFQGLRAFQEADANRFHGRDNLIARVKSALYADTHHGNFLALGGASGSGKSSVIRAGLIPNIYNDDSLSNQYISTMMPSSTPFRQLEGAVLNIAQSNFDTIIQLMKTEQYNFNEVLKLALPTDGEMLLFIDQFEELFTLVAEDSQRRAFLAMLYDAITADDSRLRLIVTIRADYLGEPLKYDNWGTLFDERLILVATMKPHELRRAIEKPATENGLVFEDGLVNMIVEDFREEVGALPLLQYTLSELYEQREGIEFTIEAYETIGGIRGALAKRANTIYSTLNHEQQVATQQIFSRLVQIRDGNKTRRRALRQEIYGTHSDRPLIDSVLDRFSKYRLLTFDYQPTDDRLPTVEIAHEALIESWSLLSMWIDDNADALRLQARLSADADQWDLNERDSSYLALDARLAQFQTLHSNSMIYLTPLESDYLTASLNLEAKRQRTQRRIQIAFGVLGLAILIAGVLAFLFAITADDQRTQAILARDDQATARAIAQANAEQSRARELAASSLLIAEDFTDTAILLALESLAVDETFEGRNALLNATLEHPFLTQFLTAHQTNVRSVDMNPDGTILVSGDNEGTVVIWDMTTSQPQHIIPSDDTIRINDVVIHPTRPRFASVDLEGRIVIRDITTGSAITVLTPTADEIRTLAYSPDGSQLAAADNAGRILIWSADDDEYDLVDGFSGHNEEPIYTITYSPDNQWLATGGADNNIILWSVEDGFSLESTLEAHRNWVFSLAFSPDSSLLVSGSADSTIRLWDIATLETIWAFQAPDQITSVAFSDDGQRIVSGDLNATIIYWDTADGAVITNYSTVSQSEVRSIALHENNIYIASDNPDILHYTLTFVPRFGQVILNPNFDLGMTVLNPNTEAIAYSAGTGSDDFTIYVTQSESLTTDALIFHTGAVTDLTWTSDNQLISVGLDRRAVIWEDQVRVADGTLSDVVWSVANTDTLIAFGLNNGSIEIWLRSTFGEADTAPIATLSEHSNRVVDLAFNSTGTTLVSGSRDGTAILWDLSDDIPVPISLTDQNAPIEAVALSPDDQIIATGSRDQSIILWDATTGEALTDSLTAHDNWVTDLAFSPNNNLLVSVSNDRSVILWSVENQLNYNRPFIAHPTAVISVDFSADGRYIVTSSLDGTVISWDLALDQWQQTACEMVNRVLDQTERSNYFRAGASPSNPCDTP